MKKFNTNLIKRSMSSILSALMCINVIGPLTAVSEGSSTMSDTNSGYRAFLEFFANESSTGVPPLYSVVPRRQIMYAYVKQGETVYLGSSVYASRFDKNNIVKSSATGCDIYVESPSGIDVSKTNGFDVIQNGTGYIGTRNQELAGPIIPGYNDSVNLPDYNENCYAPLSFVAEETGVYAFYFHSNTGKRESPTSTLINDNAFTKNQKDGLVGAWDITIFDSEDQIKRNGRVFTNYLAWSTGFNSTSQQSILYSDVYVVTNDGYIYNTNFNGLDPNGFVFFANNRGLIDTATNTPAYCSYLSNYDNFVGGLDSNGLAIHSPAVGDTDLDQTYKIFFDSPDPELIGDYLPIAYEPTPAKNFKFVGTRGEGGTYIGAGGYFTFDVENATSATITIDMSKILVTDETTGETIQKDYGVIKLSDVVTPGQTNSFYWDGYGYDENGNRVIVPTGSYNNNSIRVSLDTHSGEYHLPLIDAEANPNGLIITRVNDIKSIRNVKVDENGIIWCENGIKITKTVDSDGYVTYTHENIANGKEIYNSLDIPVTQMKLDVTQEYEDSKYNVYYNNQTIVNGIPGKDFGIADELDYSEYPCNSQNGAMIYSKPGNTNVISPIENATVGNGYGNAALLDMWTFSVGERIEVSLAKEINIVEELTTMIKGNVFFDANNNGRFNLNDNDYNLSEIDVTIQYHPFKYQEVVDEDGNTTLEVAYDEETHQAILDLSKWESQSTKSDVTGNYYFYDIPFTNLAEYENNCIITISSPNGVYSVSTSNVATNDFVRNNIKGTLEQSFNIGINSIMPNLDITQDSNIGVTNIGIVNVSDVGFYYKEKNDEKIFLKKEWRIDSSFDQNRPNSIDVTICGVDSTGLIVVEKTISLDVYSDWKNYVSNLPSTKNGKPITYFVSNEYFEYLNETYRFDGTTYYKQTNDGEVVIDSPPYKSTIINSNKHISGEYQSVIINAPLQPTLQIVKTSAEDTSLHLADAEFTLYKITKNDDGSESYTQVAGPLKTNENGLCLFRGDNILEGEYLIETKVPNGYFTEPNERIQIFKDYHYPEDIIVDSMGTNTVFTENQIKIIYNKPIKYLVITKTYMSDDKQIQTKDLLSETIHFNITPFGNNIGPTFDDSLCNMKIGTGVDETRISLPDFSNYPVGDYWYTLSESSGNTAGVTYDDNIYYLRISVVRRGNATVNSIGQIEIHSNAPNDDGLYLSDDLVSGFINEFDLGSLNISKTLSGNMADKNKAFDVKITLSTKNNATVQNTISYGNNKLKPGWTGSKTITVSLKKDESISITDIPVDVTYKILETNYSTEGYSIPVYTLANNETNDIIKTHASNWNSNYVTGNIENNVDSISIKNVKNVPIDIGVDLTQKPFVILLICTVLVVIILISKKFYNLRGDSHAD